MNEALFRDVNERIKELQSDFAVREREPLHIVCECDRLDCTEQISVEVDTYEKVRSDGTLFFVCPGHQDDTVEGVVGTGHSYLVVRKQPGDPQAIAERTDPRS